MKAGGKYLLNIKGDVSGQIAIGNHIMQIQNYGGVVNIVKPPPQSSFKKRTRPVQRRPRPYPALLDRVPESLAVQSSLRETISTSVFGEGGIGKTTFLSHMAHLPETNAFTDGVVYLYVKQQGLDDLLQILFDTFYSGAENVMPTTGQLRHRLERIRAVILLDDLDLAREDVQALIAVMPLSCFILASVERSLWGDGKKVFLGGLPEHHRMELFEAELGRPLSEDEKVDARFICDYLQGHPLKIIQTASLVAMKGRTIAEIRQQFQKAITPFAWQSALVNTLDESQQRVLAVLGASGGALVPQSIFASLLKLADVQPLLGRLVDMGLAWAHGSSYGLTGGWVSQIGELWDLSSWEDALINYFVDWLSQQPQDILIENAADVLVRVIQDAGEKKRWPEVIRIGRGLERILILRKRWQAWQEILTLILNAAKAYGDRSTEAWALHQLGSRAMCLDYADQAYDLLTQAFNIRQAIGDRDGLAVTRHNLNVLQHVPVSYDKQDINWRRYFNYGWRGLSLVTIFVLLFFAGSRVFAALFVPATSTITLAPSLTHTLTPSHTPTNAPSFTPTFTLTPSQTPTDTPTYTPTFTLTPTPTPTWTSTPTNTPDTVGPLAPVILGPKNNKNYGCLPNSQVILEWEPPKDASGIASYNIALLGSPNNDNWTFFWTYTVSGKDTRLNVTKEVRECNILPYFKWYIKANDKAGNHGEWSPWAYFRAVKVIE